MENKTPKFRLENITLLPVGISNVIKEIIAEISHNNQLRPALVHNDVCVPYTGQCATQSGHGINYCNSFCSCDTKCSCDDHCNHCGCVSFCACEEFGGCDCYSNYDTPPCPYECNTDV